MQSTEQSRAAETKSLLVGRKRQTQRRPSSAGTGHSHSDVDHHLTQVVAEVRKTLKCEAVGIRLIDENGNADYCAWDGFPAEFAQSDTRISLYNNDCVCAHLMSGDVHSDTALCNQTRSFIAGSARERDALAGNPHADNLHPARACCKFQSMAVTGIECFGHRLGLIHCADSHPNWFNSDSIQALDEYAAGLGRFLFFDSLWKHPESDVAEQTTAVHTICPICGRFRTTNGQWLKDRRNKSRATWPALPAARAVCPHCLTMCGTV